MRQRRGLPARAAQRGFTLVEVLIVMVIIGVSASLVLSSFDRTLKTSEERQWVEKTLRQLNRIKAQAILSSRPQQLNVNFANATLALQVDAANENVLLSLPEKYEFTRVRGADETVLEVLDPADDKLRLTFFPDGSTSGARFDLAAPKTGAHHILVHGLTGKVEEARGSEESLLADLQLRPLKNGLEAALVQPPQPAPAPVPGTPAGTPPPAPAAPGTPLPVPRP
ncbi:MAG: type II secretion system protein [Sulfuricella sp.]|nr:type II secretion system protein [Sulfuricella sp.]